MIYCVQLTTNHREEMKQKDRETVWKKEGESSCRKKTKKRGGKIKKKEYIR